MLGSSKRGKGIRSLHCTLTKPHLTSPYLTLPLPVQGKSIDPAVRGIEPLFPNRHEFASLSDKSSLGPSSSRRTGQRRRRPSTFPPPSHDSFPGKASH